MNNSKLKRFHPILKPQLYFIVGLALCFRLPGFDAVLVSDELAMVSIWGQMPYEKIFPKHFDKVTVKFGKPLKFKKSDSYDFAIEKIYKALDKL